jgi:hypothetical protein
VSIQGDRLCDLINGFLFYTSHRRSIVWARRALPISVFLTAIAVILGLMSNGAGHDTPLVSVAVYVAYWPTYLIFTLIMGKPFDDVELLAGYPILLNALGWSAALFSLSELCAYRKKKAEP